MNMTAIVIQWGFVLPILAVHLTLMLVALLDLTKSERKTHGPKWLWVLLAIIIVILGPLVYFTAGKRKN